MRTFRWLTLGAAIVITVLEVWLFAGASTAVALQAQSAAPAVMVTQASGGAP